MSKDQFEIILVHVHMRARYLIITHVREIEGRAVTMAGLGDGVDVSAALQVLDIFLRAEHRCHVEPVMRQVIPTEDIRPLGADSIQLALGGRDEVRHGMRQTIDDIVVVGLDLHQLLAHRGGVGSVFRRTRQPYPAGHVVLTRLEIIELQLIAERPSWVPNEGVFDDFLLGRRRGRAAAEEGKDR